MLERPMATRRLTQAIVLAALSLLWATNAQAEELRCIGLGANCICSEPLDTPTLVGSTYWWNPADSITKECSGEEASIGGAILRNSAPISSTDATAMAALPSGHTMLSFVRGEDDHQGIFFVGNGLPVSASFVRLAARWYIWHTPIFDFKGEGTCENSKIAEFDNDSRVDVTGGFHSYNYLTFSPPIDCCVSGPGRRGSRRRCGPNERRWKATSPTTCIGWNTRSIRRRVGGAAAAWRRASARRWWGNG